MTAFIFLHFPTQSHLHKFTGWAARMSNSDIRSIRSWNGFIQFTHFCSSWSELVRTRLSWKMWEYEISHWPLCSVCRLNYRNHFSFRFCVFCDWSELAKMKGWCWFIFQLKWFQMHAFVSLLFFIFYIAFAWQYLNRFSFQIQKKLLATVKKKYLKSLSKSHSGPFWVFQTRNTSKFCSAKRWRSPHVLRQSYCWRRVLWWLTTIAE